MSNKGGGDDDVDILPISRKEAHRTIDNQINTLNDIDSKAARILRLNLVIIGIVLTGVSLASHPESSTDAPLYYSDLDNNYIISGFVFLLASTAAAAITYTASSLKGGVGPNDLRKFINNDLSDRGNLEGLVEAYAQWIEYNYKVNAKNAPLGTLTLLLLILSIASLSLGVKHIVTGEVEIWLLAGTVILYAIVVYTTGFYEQVKRYRRIRRRSRQDE